MVTTYAGKLIDIYEALLAASIGYDLDGDKGTTAEEIAEAADSLIDLCAMAKWNDLRKQAIRFKRHDRKDRGTDGMKALSIELRDAYTAKLSEIHLVIVDEADAKLYTCATRQLCGAPLRKRLAQSTAEFDLAGRAVAVGLWTASVAHSMRSVEASLHSLAQVVGGAFLGTSHLQEWKYLTENLSAEIKRQDALPKSMAKTKRLKVLSTLLIPADGFRVAWRNHVAHARETYGEPVARQVLGHVGEFLSTLPAAL